MKSDRMRASTLRLSFAGLVRSEVLKARGLRSIRWLLVIAAALPVLSSLIVVTVSKDDAASPGDFLLSAVAELTWMPLLVVMLLGTVVATAEYEHGSLQTTFAIAPGRTAVVLAKTAVVGLTVGIVLLVSLVVAFLAAAAVVGEGAVGALGSGEVVRVLVGTALYGAAAAVIATAISLVVRSSIAGISATLGFLYVLPALLQAIPVAAVTAFARTIPGPASTPLDTPGHVAGEMSFGTALLAVVAWTIVTVAVSCLVLRRRDV